MSLLNSLFVDIFRIIQLQIMENVSDLYEHSISPTQSESTFINESKLGNSPSHFRDMLGLKQNSALKLINQQRIPAIFLRKRKQPIPGNSLSQLEFNEDELRLQKLSKSKSPLARDFLNKKQNKEQLSLKLTQMRASYDSVMNTQRMKIEAMREKLERSSEIKPVGDSKRRQIILEKMEPSAYDLSNPLESWKEIFQRRKFEINAGLYGQYKKVEESEPSVQRKSQSPQSVQKLLMGVHQNQAANGNVTKLQNIFHVFESYLYNGASNNVVKMKEQEKRQLAKDYKKKKEAEALQNQQEKLMRDSCMASLKGQSPFILPKIKEAASGLFNQESQRYPQRNDYSHLQIESFDFEGNGKQASNKFIAMLDNQDDLNRDASQLMLMSNNPIIINEGATSAGELELCIENPNNQNRVLITELSDHMRSRSTLVKPLGIAQMGKRATGDYNEDLNLISKRSSLGLNLQNPKLHHPNIKSVWTKNSNSKPPNILFSGRKMHPLAQSQHLKQNSSRLTVISKGGVMESQRERSPEMLEISQILQQCNKSENLSELRKKTHRIHESFMDYKEDIQKVIQLIEDETQDTTNSAKDSTISELIRKFRLQQKLTQIGDSNSPKPSIQQDEDLAQDDYEDEDGDLTQVQGSPDQDLIDVMSYHTISSVFKFLFACQM